MKLDHIVFGARDLAQGIAFMSDALGAAPCAGGKHPLMGTHNALWRLEAREYSVYLEVIAIDPDAEQPTIARWYGLDNVDVQSRLAKGVSLLTYALQSDNIDADRAALPFDPGTPTEVRRGHLSWLFTVTDDGNLIADGALPHLISWRDTPHPTSSMPDQGLKLSLLEAPRALELNVAWPCEVKHSKDHYLAVKIEKNCGKSVHIKS